MSFKVIVKKGDDTLLTLETEERSRAKAVKAICAENDLDCFVTKPSVEQAVKFRGID